jgi:Anti-sigma-K factor rskA
MTDEETGGRIEDPDEERAVAAFLDTVAPTLRDEAVWVEPPAGLADSIVAAIAAERRPGAARPTAVPTAPPVVAATRRRSRATWWIGAAAAAAVGALAVGIIVTRDDGESDVQFAIDGTDLDADAAATAVVNELSNGAAIQLDVENLDPAPEGSYYQGWVRSAAGETVPIGTFHMRGGDGTVTLWSGVDIAAYPTLTVTLQEEGAGPESSGQVVLRGLIVP